ncbi:MAG: hypothetical protein ABII64_07730 [Elusimicrobiota bacterium]
MKTLILKPVKITKKLLDRLERRGLITQLRFTKRSIKTKNPNGIVDLVYKTAPEFGPQKLICVAKKQLHIEMTAHGDREELLILNSTGRKLKPLYLIIALDKRERFNRKVRQRRLGAGDVMAIELKYNDPVTSVFVMNGNVPHCEVTAPGKGQHPLFFVTEPADLSFSALPTPGYKLIINK